MQKRKLIAKQNSTAKTSVLPTPFYQKSAWAGKKIGKIGKIKNSQKRLKIGTYEKLRQPKMAKFSKKRLKFGQFFQNFYRQKIGSRFWQNSYRLQGSENRPFADKSAELVTLKDLSFANWEQCINTINPLCLCRRVLFYGRQLRKA